MQVTQRRRRLQKVKQSEVGAAIGRFGVQQGSLHNDVNLLMHMDICPVRLGFLFKPMTKDCRTSWIELLDHTTDMCAYTI